MKIRTFTSLILAGMLSLNSCVNNGDIDELQDQINDLNSTVETLQKTQQEALLAAIASLTADLVSLENELGSDIDDLGTDYNALLVDLGILENEVEGNAKAVFYGNVITEADYTALTAQGATIITGRVVIGGDAHVAALANVKLIGKNLEINGGATISLPALQSVGEDLLVSGLNTSATINLAKLASVGGDVEIRNNAGLTSVMANELVLISGRLSSEVNGALTALSFSKLDQVNEIYVNEYVEGNWDNPQGVLAMLDVSATNVNGNVFVSYVGDVDTLSFGNVNGNFVVTYSKIVNISISGMTLAGDFKLDYNTRLKTVATPNLKRIEGLLNIAGNLDYNAPGSSLTDLPAFSALKYIGGTVTISSNGDLVTADSFNSVTEVAGDRIDFSGNGKFESINIFNALTDTYSQYQDAHLFLSAQTNWFNGFSEVSKLNEISITIQVPAEDDGGFGISSAAASAVTGVAKMEGFGKLTSSTNLQLYISEVTEFNAFGSYTGFLRSYGTGLVIQMPAAEVGMCSMEPFLAKVKAGDFDSKPMKFQETIINEWGWPESVDVDKDIAVDRLLAPCGV